MTEMNVLIDMKDRTNLMKLLHSSLTEIIRHQKKCDNKWGSLSSTKMNVLIELDKTAQKIAF